MRSTLTPATSIARKSYAIRARQGKRCSSAFQISTIRTSDVRLECKYLYNKEYVKALLASAFCFALAMAVRSMPCESLQIDFLNLCLLMVGVEVIIIAPGLWFILSRVSQLETITIVQAQHFCWVQNASKVIELTTRAISF